MATVFFLMLLLQLNLFLAALDDADKRTWNCDKASDYSDCGSTSTKTAEGSISLCRGTKITKKGDTEDADVYATRREQACKEHGRRALQYDRTCRFGKLRPVCDAMFQPEHMLGNVYECGDGSQGGGGVGCSTACIEKPTDPICPLDSTDLTGVRHLPSKLVRKYKLLEGQTCDTFTNPTTLAGGSTGCMSGSLTNVGDLFKHIVIDYSNELPCFERKWADGSTVWYLGRRKWCVRHGTPGSVAAHEEYEDLLDDYYYDIAVEQAKEERALRKLRREKNAILKTKHYEKNLYY